MPLLGPNITTPIAPTHPPLRALQGRRTTIARCAAVRRLRLALKRTLAPQTQVLSQPEANYVIELMKPFEL